MTSPDDASAVEAAAGDYIEGWYTGDATRMDRALHPDLVKRILDTDVDSETGELRVVTKDRMVELTAAGGGENPDAEFTVTVDDISETIASARVLSPEYLDYLQLARTPAGWKIVNVLFRTHE